MYQCKTWIRHRGSVSAEASGAVTLHWRSAVTRGHVHHSGGRCTKFCSDSSPSRPDCDAAGRLETFPFSPLLSLRLPLLPLCIKQLAATSPRILGRKFFRKTKCVKILRKIQYLQERSYQKWSLSLHTYGMPVFSIWKLEFEYFREYICSNMVMAVM